MKIFLNFRLTQMMTLTIKWKRKPELNGAYVRISKHISLAHECKPYWKSRTLYSHGQELFYKFVSKINNKLVKQLLSMTVEKALIFLHWLEPWTYLPISFTSIQFIQWNKYRSKSIYFWESFFYSEDTFCEMKVQCKQILLYFLVTIFREVF